MLMGNHGTCQDQCVGISNSKFMLKKYGEVVMLGY